MNNGLKSVINALWKLLNPINGIESKHYVRYVCDFHINPESNKWNWKLNSLNLWRNNFLKESNKWNWKVPDGLEAQPNLSFKNPINGIESWQVYYPDSYHGFIPWIQ